MPSCWIVSRNRFWTCFLGSCRVSDRDPQQYFANYKSDWATEPSSPLEVEAPCAEISQVRGKNAKRTQNPGVGSRSGSLHCDFGRFLLESRVWLCLFIACIKALFTIRNTNTVRLVSARRRRHWATTTELQMSISRQEDRHRA